MLDNQGIEIIKQNIFEIDRKLKLKEKEEELLFQRRKLLFRALEEKIIPKPVKVKRRGFLNFFLRKHDFQCPLCNRQLNQIFFHEMYSLFSSYRQRYTHLVCPNNDYEAIVKI